MSRIIDVHNQSNPDSSPIRVKYCADFWSKFRGLMLHPPLQVNEGVLLVEDRDSKVNASIHMLFMRFDLCVVWINGSYQVVDVQICQRWKPVYVPAQPARYILEAHVSQKSHFSIGDHVSFVHE